MEIDNALHNVRTRPLPSNPAMRTGCYPSDQSLNIHEDVLADEELTSPIDNLDLEGRVEIPALKQMKKPQNPGYLMEFQRRYISYLPEMYGNLQVKLAQHALDPRGTMRKYEEIQNELIKKYKREQRELTKKFREVSEENYKHKAKAQRKNQNKNLRRRAKR